MKEKGGQSSAPILIYAELFHGQIVLRLQRHNHQAGPFAGRSGPGHRGGACIASGCGMLGGCEGSACLRVGCRSSPGGKGRGGAEGAGGRSAAIAGNHRGHTVGYIIDRTSEGG